MLGNDTFVKGLVLRIQKELLQLDNIKTNKRVRIDFNKGELLYFIAGASDNWKQVVNVPIEMDYVITALLFRNYSFEDELSEDSL